jgi:hypothetical protein
MMGLNYQRIYGWRQKSLNLTHNPIGVANEDDLNLYAYVGNDPLDHVDPSGNYTDAMGDFYPGTKEEPGDFNPLTHPVATAAVLGASVATTACVVGGCECAALWALGNPVTATAVVVGGAEAAAGPALGPGNSPVTAAVQEAKALANTTTIVTQTNKAGALVTATG